MVNHKSLHGLPSCASLASTVVSEESEAFSVNMADVSRRPQTTRGNSSVVFSSVQVRVYSRTVGDHPDVTRGAPVTLDWDFQDHSEVDILQFEENRPERKRFLRMSAASRKSLLEDEFEASEQELEAASREAEMVRMQRQESSKDTDSVWSNIERKPRMKKQASLGKRMTRKGMFKNLRRSFTSRA